MAVVTRSNPATTRRLASPAVRSLLRRRIGESVGIALGLFGVALLVALASHNPADPSLNTATTRATSNLAGPAGAVLSDLLLQGFGVAGALPGIAMIAWCWRIASHRGIGSPAVRIEGGTDEILRNIIAERVLGLPADIRADKGMAFNQIPTKAG